MSGTSPLKTEADIPRHDLWNQMLHLLQATEGLDLLHVTARSQIQHRNFGFRFGGVGLGTVAFGIDWNCRLGLGFSCMTPQESSTRKCIVSAPWLWLLG